MSYTEQDVERVAEALAKRLFNHRALSSPLHRDVLMEKARGHAVAALEAIEREPQPFPSMVGDRDALRELIYDDPILTDDQKREVYRIAEAIRVRVRSNYPELRDIGDRPDAWAYPARILLGMVPRPLEDVLRDTRSWLQHLDMELRDDGQFSCAVYGYEVIGTDVLVMDATRYGADPVDAIRNAVAAANEGR